MWDIFELYRFCNFTAGQFRLKSAKRLGKFVTNRGIEQFANNKSQRNIITNSRKAPFDILKIFDFGSKAKQKLLKTVVKPIF